MMAFHGQYQLQSSRQCDVDIYSRDSRELMRYNLKVSKYTIARCNRITPLALSSLSCVVYSPVSKCSISYHDFSHPHGYRNFNLRVIHLYSATVHVRLARLENVLVLYANDVWRIPLTTKFQPQPICMFSQQVFPIHSGTIRGGCVVSYKLPLAEP